MSLSYTHAKGFALSSVSPSTTAIIMPATDSTLERSLIFSALRRVKNYLRTTMCQRLINLLDLHVHKELTDTLDLKSTATEFIGDSEHRLRI